MTLRTRKARRSLVASSQVAGIVGGLGAAPKGRGQMVRQLTA